MAQKQTDIVRDFFWNKLVHRQWDEARKVLVSLPLEQQPKVLWEDKKNPSFGRPSGASLWGDFINSLSSNPLNHNQEQELLVMLSANCSKDFKRELFTRLEINFYNQFVEWNTQKAAYVLGLASRMDVQKVLLWDITQARESERIAVKIHQSVIKNEQESVFKSSVSHAQLSEVSGIPIEERANKKAPSTAKSLTKRQIRDQLLLDTLKPLWIKLPDDEHTHLMGQWMKDQFMRICLAQLSTVKHQILSDTIVNGYGTMYQLASAAAKIHPDTGDQKNGAWLGVHYLVRQRETQHFIETPNQIKNLVKPIVAFLAQEPMEPTSGGSVGDSLWFFVLEKNLSIVRSEFKKTYPEQFIRLMTSSSETPSVNGPVNNLSKLTWRVHLNAMLNDLSSQLKSSDTQRIKATLNTHLLAGIKSTHPAHWSQQLATSVAELSGGNMTPQEHEFFLKAVLTFPVIGVERLAKDNQKCHPLFLGAVNSLSVLETLLTEYHTPIAIDTLFPQGPQTLQGLVDHFKKSPHEVYNGLKLLCQLWGRVIEHNRDLGVSSVWTGPTVREFGPWKALPEVQKFLGILEKEQIHEHLSAHSIASETQKSMRI